MITAIRDSADLAAVLNATPATPEDAAETPRDWIEGIWVAGEVYLLDPDATTDTLAVLADGTGAVLLSPKGKYCNGGHEHRPNRGGWFFDSEHWCPADREEWTETEDARGVVRDWRSVYVWDANGFSDTTVYPTLDEAKAAFNREQADLEETGRMLLADAGMDADEDF